jgi:transposase
LHRECEKTVVTDNVVIHKVACIRQAIEDRGAMLPSLPPYSPDLTPIERAFVKIKATPHKIGAPPTRGSLARHIISG